MLGNIKGSWKGLLVEKVGRAFWEEGWHEQRLRDVSMCWEMEVGGWSSTASGQNQKPDEEGEPGLEGRRARWRRDGGSHQGAGTRTAQ